MSAYFDHRGRRLSKARINRISEETVEEEEKSRPASHDSDVPHLWKEEGSVQNNVARRSVAFSPPQGRASISYFTVQEPWIRETLQQGFPVEESDEESNQEQEVLELRPHEDESDTVLLEEEEEDIEPPQEEEDKEEEMIDESRDDVIEVDFKDSLGAVQTTQENLSSPDRRISGLARGKTYQAPTQLHDLCFKATSANDLLHFMQGFPGSPKRRTARDISTASTQKDYLSRIPLHIFSENGAVADSVFPMDEDGIPSMISSVSSKGDVSSEKEVTRFLLDVLVAAHPTGMKWQDANGHIPFQRVLIEWIHNVHEENSPKSRKWGLGSRRLSSYSRLSAPSRLHHIVHSGAQSVTTAIAWAGKSLPFQKDSPRKPSKETDLEDGVPTSNLSKDNSGVAVEELETIFQDYAWALDRFPSHVRLTPQAKFAIKMVSTILDELEEHDVVSRSFKRTSTVKRRSDGSGPRYSDSFDGALDDFRDYCFTESSDKITSFVVQELAGIPNLVKTLFLLDDEDEREWVLSSTLFRRIVLHENSIGPWLTAMLQSSHKRVSQRGLQYLGYLSHVLETNAEGWGVEGRKSSTNLIRGSHAHDKLHEKVSELDGFIPSLLALDERGIEEAATTLIVRKVLDRMISRPFAVSVVLFDAMFLTLLILSFRAAVHIFLTGGSGGTVLTWIYVANSCTFYFVIRELGKAITILERTKKARIYFLSFWNLTDILSIFLALSSTIAIRVQFKKDEINFDDLTQLRGCLAVTTGLLWLRVLSLLKSINMQLATFVLAIFQITRDILWFLLLLLTTVVAFAQIFYTILVPPECASNDDKSVGADVCNSAEYYLRTYMILLGDFGNFDRGDFHTPFGVIMIVCFSFMVVVVLLNVLIAIVSDSYEKCLIRSQSLFGRARVMLIAELVSFQNLLKSDSRKDGEAFPSVYNQWWIGTFIDNRWSRASAMFFCLSALVVLGWFLAETIGFFTGKRVGNFLVSLCSILVNVILFLCIVAFLSNGATSADEKNTKRKLHRNGCVRFFLKWYDQVIQRAMLRLLGSHKKDSMLLRKNETEEWSGRVYYLHQEMSRLAEESNAHMNEHAKAMEHSVAYSESRLRIEVKSVEQNMIDFKLEIMNELKDSEQRMEAMMQQSMNKLLQALATDENLDKGKARRL